MRHMTVCKLFNTYKKSILIQKKFHHFQRIADLIMSNEEKNTAAIKGWVRAIRKMKGNIFVDVDDGSSTRYLQVVLEKSSTSGDVDYGSAIEALGTLARAPSGQLELKADEIHIIGKGQLQEGYPFAPRKSYTPDYCRQFLHLRPRLSQYAAVLRVRNSASMAFRHFFQNCNYLEVQPPILTSNDCEGAGEVFKIAQMNQNISDGKSLPPEQIFDTDTFLTVSAQLHLEVLARSLSQVYCFAPTFRAENSKSRFHLSEFLMLEAETTLVKSNNDLINFVEEMLRTVITSTLNLSFTDIDKCRKRFSESDFILEEILKKSWLTITYEEAASILANHSSSLKVIHTPDTSFTKEHELFLTNHFGNIPIFIIDWPKKLKSFYMKTKQNDSNKVEAFDLLFPKVGEICGGSLREDDINKLTTVLEKHKGLEWYLELRKFGNVVTGGFGLGFDRFLMSFLNISNIKDVVPFPRFPHHCQL